MTELSFAKSFLSTLDSKPVKLQADHAADPKTFEPKGAVSLPFPISDQLPETRVSLDLFADTAIHFSTPFREPLSPCAVVTPQHPHLPPLAL